MRVGVLGTGNVGRALGRGFLATGNSVRIGSRSAFNAIGQEWAATNGTEASAGTFADAAGYGDLVVFATPGILHPDIVSAAGPASFDGKVVIDATNPLDDSVGFPPRLAIAGEDSGGELLQRLLPKARVVKAFNIVNHRAMYRPNFVGGPPDMMIAGNDDGAKATVTDILRAFGWSVVDLGGIASSRWLEAMCMAWVMAGAVSGDYNRAFKLLPGAR